MRHLKIRIKNVYFQNVIDLTHYHQFLLCGCIETGVIKVFYTNLHFTMQMNKNRNAHNEENYINTSTLREHVPIPFSLPAFTIRWLIKFLKRIHAFQIYFGDELITNHSTVTFVEWKNRKKGEGILFYLTAKAFHLVLI